MKNKALPVVPVPTFNDNIRNNGPLFLFGYVNMYSVPPSGPRTLLFLFFHIFKDFVFLFFVNFFSHLCNLLVAELQQVALHPFVGIVFSHIISHIRQQINSISDHFCIFNFRIVRILCEIKNQFL